RVLVGLHLVRDMQQKRHAEDVPGPHDLDIVSAAVGSLVGQIELDVRSAHQLRDDPADVEGGSGTGRGHSHEGVVRSPVESGPRVVGVAAAAVPDLKVALKTV